MIELPPPNDKHYRAIHQRVVNSARSLRANDMTAPVSYPALAMVQTGIGELAKVYGREATAGLLVELAGELGEVNTPTQK